MPAADIRSFVFKPIALVVLFFVLAAFKMPAVMAHGRMWAEDGSYFLAAMFERSFWGALTLTFSGTLQLSASLITWVAAQAPRGLMPYITTYGALGVALLVFLQMAGWAQRRNVPPGMFLLLAVAWFFTADSYEQWANPCTVQFVCSVSVLFVLLLDEAALRRHMGPWLAWSVVCGLTGPQSCMLAPFFLYRAYTLRSRPHGIVGAALGVCSLVQLILLARLGTEAVRPFTDNPLEIANAIMIHTVYAPLEGYSLFTLIHDFLNPVPGWLERVVYLVLTAFIYGALLRLLKHDRERYSETLLILAVTWIVSAISAIGSKDGASHLMIVTVGGRYFLLGMTCLSLMLANVACGAMTARGRALGVVLIALMAAVSVSGRAFDAPLARYLEGPSWQEQITACHSAAPCNVRIWPKDSEWYVTLPAER